MKFIEINEAFAAMPLVSTLVLANYERRKAEKIRERVNINGGAVAIGHPIGATGARLLMNMLYELRRQGEAMAWWRSVERLARRMRSLSKCNRPEKKPEMVLQVQSAKCKIKTADLREKTCSIFEF